MLCIINGRIIDPEQNKVYPGDVWIEDGIIRKIAVREEGKGADAGELPEGAEVLNAEGMMLGPGLIDTHVHFRDPGFTYKEDILSGGEAAKKGGYTGIVLMANTRPPVDNRETLRYVLEKGKQTGIRIESCANVTKGMKGKEIVDMEGLSEEGAAGFTDDGIPLLNKELVKEAMLRAAGIGKPVSFHEEDPAKIVNNGINAGKASDFYGIGGSHREAEIDLIERDLELALETGARVVIQHISSKEGVELVRRAKAKNADVHAEATPHHFTLTQEAVIEKGTLAKMNPPLREEEDRLAIIEGLKDGTIDLIATDHAPHSREEKAQEITKAPSGIIGLETALSLGIRELVNKGYLTYPQLFSRMSAAPAELYGLPGGKMQEGQTADLVIFDPKEEWKVREFVSRSDNSPFTGEILPGVIYYTICGGEIVYIKNI
ncbi:MAG: dihydroorotase [Lachnospiraceae bacterium]|nr:dihydroorotase [Lachnospiraceae bacterium]